MQRGNYSTTLAVESPTHKWFIKFQNKKDVEECNFVGNKFKNTSGLMNELQILTRIMKAKEQGVDGARLWLLPE